jgi:hypothetical protein
MLSRSGNAFRQFLAEGEARHEIYGKKLLWTFPAKRDVVPYSAGLDAVALAFACALVAFFSTTRTAMIEPS